MCSLACSRTAVPWLVWLVSDGLCPLSFPGMGSAPKKMGLGKGTWLVKSALVSSRVPELVPGRTPGTWLVEFSRIKLSGRPRSAFAGGPGIMSGQIPCRSSARAVVDLCRNAPGTWLFKETTAREKERESEGKLATIFGPLCKAHVVNSGRGSMMTICGISGIWDSPKGMTSGLRAISFLRAASLDGSRQRSLQSWAHRLTILFAGYALAFAALDPRVDRRSRHGWVAPGCAATRTTQ